CSRSRNATEKAPDESLPPANGTGAARHFFLLSLWASKGDNSARGPPFPPVTVMKRCDPKTNTIELLAAKPDSPSRDAHELASLDHACRAAIMYVSNRPFTGSPISTPVFS